MTEDSLRQMSAQEANRRLVELCRRVAIEKGDKARAREWAHVSYERKGEILAELLARTAAMAEGRGGGWPKPPPMSVRARLEDARKRREG